MPGAAWWIGGRRGARSCGAVGEAVRVPTSEPTSEDTPYDLASLTKPLATALLALLLAEDRGIDLDAPASVWLHELADSPYAETTLSDLAAHRSGLPAWRPLYLEVSRLAECVSAIARQSPAGPRGGTLYSDLGYILLGAVLERATGSTLDRLFEDRIARPLGLVSSGFAAVRPERFARAAATEIGNEYERELTAGLGGGHAWRTGVLRGEVHDGNAHGLGGVAGHAGLFGTAREVASIALEILDPWVLPLGTSGRERALRPVAGPGSRSFGWEFARDCEAARGALPDDAPGHTGFTGTSVWLEPRSGEVFVLLTNRVHPRVTGIDFQSVRRGFHAIAAAANGSF
jgi:CubicO group peptidase (beta-lactamase class C family)